MALFSMTSVARCLSVLAALGSSACVFGATRSAVPSPSAVEQGGTAAAPTAGASPASAPQTPSAATSPTTLAPLASGEIPELEQSRPETVRALLAVLAADSMEGRATGARGSARAARFIAERMAAVGLLAAGDSGYFQRVPLWLRPPSQPGRPARPSGVRTWAQYNALPANQRTIGVNVVGILPGTDSALRSEAILVDAHYDHVGIGPAVNGDSIYNGADDDGSGTVAVIEIARIIARQGGNRRTIVFAATTGEEVGLLGTNWYIAYPPFPLGQTVANFEIEMIGRPDSLSGGRGKGWLTGYDLSTMGPMLAAAGVPVVADPRPSQNFFQRSDNIAFARLGMVAHTWSSYNLHTDYHTPSDEVSAIDFDHMAMLIDGAARAVWVLANGPTPMWNPGGRPAGRPASPVLPPSRPPR